MPAILQERTSALDIFASLRLESPNNTRCGWHILQLERTHEALSVQLNDASWPCAMRRRFRADDRKLRRGAEDRNSSRGHEYAARWLRRPPGPQRLQADNPSPGQPIYRLYRPPWRHARDPGARQSADRTGRIQRYLDRGRH